MQVTQTNTITIRLPDEVVDYLQALDYEIGGLQVLHTHALNAGTPPEQMETIQQRFQERFSEYQLAKQEMFQAYGQPCKRWWVDFQEGVLHLAR